jgi:hypothetical protein
MSKIHHRPDASGATAGAEASARLDRRTFLKATAGTALAAIAGTEGAQAQVTGLMPGGGKVPFKLPMGAMAYLDRNEYINNMEIVSHIEGPRTAGGEPLMAMWARGDQRLLPAGSGWVDVSDPRNPTRVEASNRISGCIIYNTRLRKWLMVESARQPNTSPIPGTPHGRYHDEVLREALGYDGLRGIRVYDINDPTAPNLLGEFSTGETGTGTHMNFYDGGRYAYLDPGYSDQLRMENSGRASSNGMMIVDMSDPENVTEVSRWHFPGQMIGEEEEYKKHWWAGSESVWTCAHGGPTVPVRVEDGGTVGYGGFGHFGMVVFDLRDIRNPKPYGVASWQYQSIGGIPYHTCYPVIAPAGHPLENIVLGIPEPHMPDCREPYMPQQVIDCSDATNPRVVGLFPRPTPPPDAPYEDFCLSRGRFGTHNIQCWVAPGTSRPEIAVTTWFNAGIRVHDISDPTNPRELAYYIPPRGGDIEEYRTWYRGDSETVFVEWDRNLIWLGTRRGSYCLTCPALGEPVLERQAIDHWTRPHLNAGWDD